MSDKDESKGLREEEGVIDCVPYDIHLECVLQELSSFARKLEVEAIKENNMLKVTSV